MHRGPKGIYDYEPIRELLDAGLIAVCYDVLPEIEKLDPAEHPFVAFCQTYGPEHVFFDWYVKAHADPGGLHGYFEKCKDLCFRSTPCVEEIYFPTESGLALLDKVHEYYKELPDSEKKVVPECLKAVYARQY